MQFAEHYTVFQKRNLLMSKVEMCGTGTNARIRGYMMVLTLSIFVRQKSLYSEKRAEKC